MKHTILGAGGSIGNALAYKLLEKGESVRLVSRSQFSIDGLEAVKADLLSYTETLESVKGSDMVYLCAGLPYQTSIWQEMWPKIIRHTIDACKSTGAKLIFFDNVYMYGRVDGRMTEDTPYNPCSRKGEVRANIARMLEDEMAGKDIDVIIARAADLYGPYANKTSMPYILIIDKLIKNKRAQWMGNADQPHTYTYTLDCANGLYLLANDKSTFNQVWHLPSYNPAINTKTFVQLVAEQIGVEQGYSVLPKFMVKVAGIFDRTIYELYEMLYQYEYSYYFDSSKFNKYFGYEPKTYEEGIKETLKSLK